MSDHAASPALYSPDFNKSSLAIKPVRAPVNVSLLWIPVQLSATTDAFAFTFTRLRLLNAGGISDDEDEDDGDDDCDAAEKKNKYEDDGGGEIKETEG